MFLKGLDQYLGCFVDHADNRDLDFFIGSFENLTPMNCIFACQQQKYEYAAVQNGKDCRCGQHYGKYAQVLDDECDVSCTTSEKCGGLNRNSVYNASEFAAAFETGSFHLKM